LQNLLDRHVERELPKVRNEIKALLVKTENDIANLGDERPTPAHMRMFLTRRSMEYCELAQAALIGNYHDRNSNFFEGKQGLSSRLRAEVHRLNGEFATDMRLYGSKRKLVASSPPDGTLQLEGKSSSENGSASEDYSDSEDGQLLVTKKELQSWVKEVWCQSPESVISDISRPTSERGAANFRATTTTFFSQSFFMSSLVGGLISLMNISHICFESRQVLLREL